jgi:AcrR family transcriptional regulator
MAKHRYSAVESRSDLLAAGREVFSELGYVEARTEEIVARAGLTRGALYHHFGDKQGLFRAVLEEIQVELATEIAVHVRTAGESVVERLRAGFQTYLDFALREDVRRILLVDGPAVLGWDAWQEIDLRHAFGATQRALELAMKSEEITDAPLNELTHVLLGAVTQAGLEIGRSEHPKATRMKYGRVVDLLIDNLRT